eukprot:8114046-Pyramimonas_sp.AAC.1
MRMRSGTARNNASWNTPSISCRRCARRPSLTSKKGAGNRGNSTKIINALVHRTPDGKLVVETDGCDELWKQAPSIRP